jgi:hypothetical protein
MQEVKYRLRSEYRKVFLSKIVIPHTGAKGGIGPRLAGVKDYECDEHGNYIMDYKGRSIEIYPTKMVKELVDKIKKHERISLEDETNLDFYLSLHKFGLHAFVTVTAMPVGISVRGQQLDQVLQIPKWKIQFVNWENIVDDTYDFNENVGIWLPNPDFRKTEQWAIAPNKEYFEFWDLRHNYLANEFVEQSWASPFEVGGTWIENDRDIIGDEIIDISEFL